MSKKYITLEVGFSQYQIFRLPAESSVEKSFTDQGSRDYLKFSEREGKNTFGHFGFWVIFAILGTLNWFRMNQDLQKIREVKENIGKLVALCDGLKERNKQLEEEKADLQEELEKKEAECREMKRQLNILRSSRVLAGDQNDPSTRARLDELVKEIDRCIGMMNG